MGPDQGTAPGLTTVLSPISHTLESSGGRLTRRSRRTLLNSGRGFLPAYGLFGIVETDLSSGRVSICGGSSARLERLSYKQDVGGPNPPRRTTSGEGTRDQRGNRCTAGPGREAVPLTGRARGSISTPSGDLERERDG